MEGHLSDDKIRIFTVNKLITDHVRSTRESNVFTRVCNSVHRRGGSVHLGPQTVGPSRPLTVDLSLSPRPWTVDPPFPQTVVPLDQKLLTCTSFYTMGCWSNPSPQTMNCWPILLPPPMDYWPIPPSSWTVDLFHPMFMCLCIVLRLQICGIIAKTY